MKTFLLACLFVIVVGAAPLLDSEGGRVIDGSYIVVLKESLSVQDRDTHIDVLKGVALKAFVDVDISYLYNISSFLGFAAKLTPELLKFELQHPDVKYVSADQHVSLIDDAPNPPLARPPLAAPEADQWNLVRIVQRTLPLGDKYVYNSSAGSGVNVYVIDTGILTTHNDFGGRASFAFTSVTNEPDTDLNGHGTACAGVAAGLLYGVAKRANLLAVKVLSGSGSGTIAAVVAGVNYVGNNAKKPAVASISLGGGTSTPLDDAVAAAIASGVPFAVAAGGSSGNACNTSPARVPTAITVGATTNTDARASYSDYGPCLTIFAPGSSITTDWIGSNTATNTLSGTSFAAPHVAGVLALHLADYPTTNSTFLKSWLAFYGTDNVITSPGTGSPNLLLYAPVAPSA